MTVLIYKKYAFFFCISKNNVWFPLKSNLIANEVAYRLLVSNITVLKNDKWKIIPK